MTNSPYLMALAGGVLIGLAAVFLLWADGRIAGISGMLGGLFRFPLRENGWRAAFLLGLITGGTLFHVFGYPVFVPLENQSWGILIAAGLLVGFGTQLGAGCTSGHGVCGIGRFSKRSLIATVTFMAAGTFTVYLVRHLLGVSL